MPINVIVTDLDGTLLGPGMSNYYHFVPEWCEMIAAFQRAGGQWVMNTGRTFKKMVEILQLQPVKVWPDFLLIQESEIFHFHPDSGQYLDDTAFNQESIRIRRELMQRVLKRWPKWYPELTRRFAIEAVRNHGTEITIVAKTIAHADAIMFTLNDWKVEISGLACNRNQRVVALMHTAYNKGVIMRRLMQLQDWHRSNVLSIGDSINDITILDGRTSQHVTAPANAEDPIKKLIEKNEGFVSDQPYGWGALHGVQMLLLKHEQDLGGLLSGLTVTAPPEAISKPSVKPPETAANLSPVPL